MTPATVHHGLAEQTHAARREVLDAASAARPERFVRHRPDRQQDDAYCRRNQSVTVRRSRPA